MELTVSTFRNQLRDINDWWTFMVDWEHGGIFAEVDVRSRTPGSDRKVLLMHVRQLYNYSVGHEHGHPESERIVRHLWETLDAVFPEKGEGLFVEALRHEPDRRVLDGYSNAYAVIGLSRFARALGEGAAVKRAWQIYADLDRMLSDAPLAEQGVWDWIDPATGERSGKSDNANLHRCEAALNLYRAMAGVSPELLQQHGKKLQDDLTAFMTFFRNRIARPEAGWTLERLNHDATPAEQTFDSMQSLGHGLEWMGFLFEIEAHCGLSIPFPEEDLRTLARKTLDNGLSPSGAFFNDYVPRYQTGPQIATFWPQVEAPLGSLWAAKRWGADLFPREEAERMLTYYRKHLFAPAEFGGGIYSTVSENGVPLRPHRGHRFKCDHHAVRMCEKVLEAGLV